MKKNKCSLIDTDIILKIGGFRSKDLLSIILLDLGYDLFVHEYIVNEELLLGDNAIRQFKSMIEQDKVKIIKISDLNITETVEYNSTVQILANEMGLDLSKKDKKNAGEVKSMAMAFIKGYEYFISDDKDARVSAKLHLQNIDGSTLETIRLKDIIIHVRDHSEKLEISRKTAKRLYLYGTNSKLGRNKNEKDKLTIMYNKLKKNFDEKIWPTNLES